MRTSRPAHAAAEGHLHQPTSQQHEDEVGANGRGADAPGDGVHHPARLAGPGVAGAPRTGRDQPERGVEGDRRYGRAGPQGGAPDPCGRIRRQEDRGQDDDEGEPRDDEARAADECPRAPRRRHAEKIASWVEAGPGRRFVAAMASSNSVSSIHRRARR